MNEGGEDDSSFDFSKLKNRFKRDKASGDSMALDLSGPAKWLKNNKKFLIYGLLVLLLLFSGWLRFMPEEKYTGIYENSLSAMDPYWHYRHANDVYEHGFVGDEEVCYNEAAKLTTKYDGSCPPGSEHAYWDFMHDAPEGSRIDQEFYPYFSAYSYKFFGRAFAPNLLVWHRWTPALFGILAVLGMFLLAKQLFGPYAGLAAGFLFSLAPSFLTRSVSGFADTDAVIGFFTVFSLYFFIKAWDNNSILYAIIGGVCLGLFGVAWPGYEFMPLLLMGMAGFFFVYKTVPKIIEGSRNFIKLVVDHLKEYWKKYAILALLLLVTLTLVGSIRGFKEVNVFEAITASTRFKVEDVVDTSVEGEDVLEVYKTVAEMNPSNLRNIVIRLHYALVLLAVGFIALLPFGLWKKVKDNTHHIAFLLLWFGATFYMSFKAMRFIGMAVFPVCIFAGITIAFLISKIKLKRPVISVIFALIIFLSIFAVPNIAMVKGQEWGVSYYASGRATADQTGPSLGPNWFDFLYWARDSTPEGSIFASWWDPGHAMTAIGERPAVADGSQNSWHIHDLAVIFTTTDENLAVERLKKYDVSYFYTSSDLINKYGAISFLSNGQGENYPFLNLAESKEVASGNVLIYPVASQTDIILELREDGMSAVISQRFQKQTIKRIFYTQNDQSYVSESDDPDAFEAMLYLQPNFQQAIFLPIHLENNMLTQLHFFNGQNLEHFEYVGNYGDEIKVFKVIYD
jgi:asparagine N-glycosylation enzyme membrane subunit Stt3|tara:strand:+ start:20177 stop:22390 length:2214 start_codon:yes stop_codon:yes gene_type:complete